MRAMPEPIMLAHHHLSKTKMQGDGELALTIVVTHGDLLVTIMIAHDDLLNDHYDSS